jgi:hypothetical protein
VALSFFETDLCHKLSFLSGLYILNPPP